MQFCQDFPINVHLILNQPGSLYFLAVEGALKKLTGIGQVDVVQ